MSKDLKLADLEAAEYVEQMKEKIITPSKPVWSAFFCPDEVMIKYRRLGYYFFVEDINGNPLAGMAFDHLLEEVSLNIEYHTILVHKVQELLARMTDQNLTISPWNERATEILNREYPGTCII